MASAHPNPDEARRHLLAAQAQLDLHHEQAETAKCQAAAAAAQAGALAQAEIAEAASVRRLEDRTAQALAGLNDLSAQDQAAQAGLRRDMATLGVLLPVMARLEQEPAATLLAVPAAPGDAVRGILLLQGIAAEIEARARRVQAQAAKVAALRGQLQAQAAALAAAAATQRQAEAALDMRIAAARSAETSDLDNAARAAAATLAAARNVQDLQSAVVTLQRREQAEAAAARPPPLPVPVPSPALSAARAPVAGTLVQRFGAPTLAGPAIGLVYRAAPAGRVIAPCSGPVLYADPFQSYGLLVILDCGGNYDFVLSGMQHLDVTVGQQLARGQPVGQMAGSGAALPARQPSLYVELRRNGRPVDPLTWLGGGSG